MTDRMCVQSMLASRGVITSLQHKVMARDFCRLHCKDGLSLSHRRLPKSRSL